MTNDPTTRNALSEAIKHGRYQLARAMFADASEAMVVRQWLEWLIIGAEASLAGEWLQLSDAAKTAPSVRLLVERPKKWPYKKRCIIECSWQDNGWWNCDAGETLASHWVILAWKPADSVELPEGWTP